MAERKKVAVIGSGCAGIAAIWALQSTDHEVHLFEKEDRLGGHTNTVTFKHHGKETQVDTGFIVMNSATYPNFIRFLKHIGIPTKNTEMTFGISRDAGAFEWAGTSLSAVFAQRQNIFSRRMWRMIFDIVRFNQYALDLLADEDESETDPSDPKGGGQSVNQPRHQQSIGEYLDLHEYSEGFRDDYLIPMTAAVWSTHPDKASLDFPAITLIRFLWNHHLLNTITVRPTWMTIPGGTKQYIDNVMKDFPKSNMHLSTPVNFLIPTSDSKIILETTGGASERYDHVILATHGDQARHIMRTLSDATEKDVLAGFNTSTNTAVLHTDRSLMPSRTLAWSSWNYLTRTPDPSSPPDTVCLTYWMNLLQHIPTATFGDVLLTLNPIHPPDPSTVQGSWTYHHPLYNAAAIRSQKLLPQIQNTKGISYAGAWTKYGFHEDGFSSGLKVAIDHLGATLPFEFVDSTFSRGRRPILGWGDYMVRFIITVIQAWIFMISMLFSYTSWPHVLLVKEGKKEA